MLRTAFVFFLLSLASPVTIRACIGYACFISIVSVNSKFCLHWQIKTSNFWWVSLQYLFGAFLWRFECFGAHSWSDSKLDQRQWRVFCCATSKFAILCLMTCKFTIVIVTTGAKAGLESIAVSLSGLILSLPRRILFPASDRVVDLGRSEVAGAFWRWQVPIAIFNNARQVEKCKCR